MRKALMLLGTGLLALTVSSVYAAGTSTTDHTAPAASAAAPAMDMKDIVSTVEGEGYKNITEVKKKGDHYKMKAEDANGKKVELKLDANGKVMKVEKD